MTITYFGYGSLVNTKTLSAQARATAGTLSGWRREWRAWWRADGTPNAPSVCTLTVVRDPSTKIRGVMVDEPADGLAVLNQRERRYVPVVEGVADAFRCDAMDAPARAGAFLYEANADIRRWGDADHPILQSYVDCVLAGFFAFWGETGVKEFIDTTDGWHAPILADRDAPRYPRAQVINPDCLVFFDECLRKSGARYLPT